MPAPSNKQDDLAASKVSYHTFLWLASRIHFGDMRSNIKKRAKTLFTRSSGTLVYLKNIITLEVIYGIIRKIFRCAEKDER